MCKTNSNTYDTKTTAEPLNCFWVVSPNANEYHPTCFGRVVAQNADMYVLHAYFCLCCLPLPTLKMASSATSVAYLSRLRGLNLLFPLPTLVAISTFSYRRPCSVLDDTFTTPTTFSETTTLRHSPLYTTGSTCAT